MSPTDKHTGTTPRSGMAGPAASPPTGLPPALGGPGALLDGGAPPLVFVVVNAVVGAQTTTRPTALLAAAAAAAATGLGIVVLRLLRKETPRQALGGLAGLTIAVLFAVASGEARGYFLPGMLVDAAYGLVFAGSALVGYPLVGTVYGLLYRRRDWRDDPRLQRLFVRATWGWSGVFAVRAGVQILFYREDLPGLLAASKLVLGWPLTLLAAVLTMAAVRRATASAGQRSRRGRPASRAHAHPEHRSATRRRGSSPRRLRNLLARHARFRGPAVTARPVRRLERGPGPGTDRAATGTTARRPASNFSTATSST